MSAEREGRGEGRDGPVPQLLVEQLALGELDEAKAAELRARLDAQRAGGTQAALDALEGSNQEILADYPAAAMAARISARAEREPRARPRSWRPYVFAPTLVAAAAVVWIIVGDPSDPTGAQLSRGEVELVEGEAERTRIKGGVAPQLQVARRTSEGHERLEARAQVQAGDELQLSYSASGREYGVILSIDGAGVVTLHHPASPEDEARLDAAELVPLGHAYELDDAPGYERFFFVTRAGEDIGGPLEVDEILRAAEALAARSPAEAREQALPLDEHGFEQQSVLLHKPAATAAPTPAGAGAGPGEGGP